MIGTGGISCAGSWHSTGSSESWSIVVLVEVLGPVLIVGSPVVAEFGLKVGADGPDVGINGVAPSIVHLGVTVTLKT